MSRAPSALRPMAWARVSSESSPPVAATVAHVLPAGPPPRMTSRVLGMRTGYRRHPRHRCGLAFRPMSELREDPLSGRLVLVAPGRAARPHTVAPATTSAVPLDCPFCPGHEDQTPPELYRTGDGAPGTPGWRVR